MIEPRPVKVTKGENQSKVVSNAQARKTALIVAVVLALLAAWNFYRVRFPFATTLSTLAVLLAFVGFFVPVGARAFHRFWMSIAGVLGYVNSRILLTLLYYGVITPYGFVARVFGRDVLSRRGDSRDTYWIPRETTRQKREQFERLF